MFLYRESIYTNVCPNPNPLVRDTERSVTMSHYQIWHAFLRVPDPKPDDLLVIFEDDVQSAVKMDKLNDILEQQLTIPKADYNFLGWCLRTNDTACCTHSYYITRHAAEVLTKYTDLCSWAIDNQIKQMYWDKALTVSFPLPSEYEKYINYPNYANYYTQGIFVQHKGLISFNGHEKNNR